MSGFQCHEKTPSLAILRIVRSKYVLQYIQSETQTDVQVPCDQLMTKTGLKNFSTLIDAQPVLPQQNYESMWDSFLVSVNLNPPRQISDCLLFALAQDTDDHKALKRSIRSNQRKLQLKPMFHFCYALPELPKKRSAALDAANLKRIELRNQAHDEGKVEPIPTVIQERTLAAYMSYWQLLHKDDAPLGTKFAVFTRGFFQIVSIDGIPQSFQELDTKITVHQQRLLWTDTTAPNVAQEQLLTELGKIQTPLTVFLIFQQNEAVKLKLLALKHRMIVQMLSMADSGPVIESGFRFVNNLVAISTITRLKAPWLCPYVYKLTILFNPMWTDTEFCQKGIDWFCGPERQQKMVAALKKKGTDHLATLSRMHVMGSNYDELL